MYIFSNLRGPGRGGGVHSMIRLSPSCSPASYHLTHIYVYVKKGNNLKINFKVKIQNMKKKIFFYIWGGGGS